MEDNNKNENEIKEKKMPMSERNVIYMTVTVVLGIQTVINSN